MAYRKGENISSGHVLTDPGEFRAIARDFGMLTALTCWVNTHPALAAAAGGAAGIAAAVALAAAILSSL